MSVSGASSSGRSEASGFAAVGGAHIPGAAILLAWALVGWSIGHSLGLYDVWSLLGLTAAGAVLVAILLVRSQPHAGWFPLAATAVVLGSIGNMVVPQWTYAGGPGVSAAHRLLELAAFAVVALALWQRAWPLVLLAPIVTGLAAGFSVTALSPHPQIDVWYFLQQSAADLLHGQDMYEGHWIGSPGLTHGYTYMPWTTVVLVPFRELLGDVRYGLVCAMALGALFVERIASSARVAPLYAMLVFLVPGGLMLSESAWTEPLLLAYLAGCILMTLNGRPALGACFLALAVATKQYAWLLLPLFAVWPPFGLRRTVQATVAGLLISLPWLIAGPSAFWSGAITDLYERPTQWYSLSLAELLVHLHETMPFLAVVAVTLIALTLGIVYTRHTGNIALAAAVVLLAFNVFARNSFYNQYWLVAEMLVVACALSIRLAADSSSASLPRQSAAS